MSSALPCLVLDLDGSLMEQGGLRQRVRDEAATLVDARDLGPRLRIVGGRRRLADLRSRINAAFTPDAGAAPLIFYGSGDFHHLAAFFLHPVTQPVTVLHFDNHPDWTRFPATWNCGAWVNRALENPAVRRVVTIGPASDDFVNPEWKTANLNAIRQGRLEMHPWHADPSRLWGRPVAGPGCRTDGGFIHWSNLADADWDTFVTDLEARLPGGGLWVSLDKDVLTEAEAITNWDQGGMHLDPILALIRRLAIRRPLLGMDVCGDYSLPYFRDPFRWFLSRTDRPERPAFDPARVRAVNDMTNRRILDFADGLVNEGIWPT